VTGMAEPFDRSLECWGERGKLVGVVAGEKKKSSKREDESTSTKCNPFIDLALRGEIEKEKGGSLQSEAFVLCRKNRKVRERTDRKRCEATTKKQAHLQRIAEC